MTTLDREYALSAWDTFSDLHNLPSDFNPNSKEFDLEVFKGFVRTYYGDSGWVYLPTAPSTSIPNNWWDSTKEFDGSPVLTGALGPDDETHQDKESVSPRAAVLREAETLITGDRNKTYGEPTDNFKNIAGLWNIRFKHKLKDGERFTAAEVADFMILMKIARNIADNKRDNAVDIAGYAACGWEAQKIEDQDVH